MKLLGFWRERRWVNWLEYAIAVGKSPWLVTESANHGGIPSGDGCLICSVSAFKRKAVINGFVYARDAFGPGKS